MINKKKKVAVIGTVGLPANYGGFETLTDHLVRNLGEEYDITVYCSKNRYKAEDRKEKYLNAKLVYLPFNANGVQSIIYDSYSILHSLFFADVLLILGVAGAWILPFVKLFTNKKVIISIDGIEWKRDKWNLLAKCYLWWAEKIAVKYSDIDISDNESIQDYTAYRYGSLSRIIEYGADHTLFVKPEDEDKKKYPFLKMPYACKVCRIEPENNVHEVLKAFSNLPKHVIVMIGNWNNSAYGRTLRDQYESFTNIIMLDPIYNQRTLDMVRGNSLVYIHGHSAGGTNPSLVEAMYLELPVIAFGVSYNKTTTEGQALYFKDSKELKSIVETVGMLKLNALSIAMKEIATRRYVWKVIAEKYDFYLKEVFVSSKKDRVLPHIANIRETILLENSAAHLKFQNLFFEK
ncbi:MAG: glycosyltransferase involved in cell wall biosynthesis [Saprospiraceae bacterium]|jgi:glycosyltransferase involved in cell wall biosynthesis